MYIHRVKQVIDYLRQEIGNLLNRNTAQLLARLNSARLGLAPRQQASAAFTPSCASRVQ
jgi:hypothetical protein